MLEYEEEAAGKDDNEINMDFEFGAGWLEDWLGTSLDHNHLLVLCRSRTSGFDAWGWSRSVWGLGLELCIRSPRRVGGEAFWEFVIFKGPPEP